MADTRKRTRSQDGTSPLTRLLDQLKRLRVPSIPAEEANALLGPLVLDCLKLCNDSSLADILWNFGWQGNAFTAPVNLFGLSTALSKYRWVRVQVRKAACCTTTHPPFLPCAIAVPGAINDRITTIYPRSTVQRAVIG
jgi:hypothetical protein